MNHIPMIHSALRGVLAGSVLLGVAAAQTSFVVPAAAAATLGTGSAGFPFSYTAYVRLQQAIGTTHFPGPVVIHAIALRSKTPASLQVPETQNQGISVTLSDSAFAPGALSTTYASNVSGTPKVVFNSTINLQRANPADALEFNTLIPFTTPYLHLNVNPLLIDLVPTSFGGQQCAGGGNGTSFDSLADPAISTISGKSGAACPSVPTAGSAGAAPFVVKFFVSNALFPFGKACAAGTTLPQISSTGTPSPGSTNFAIQMTGAPAGAPSLAALLLGASASTWGSQALPWSLAAWNMPSCFLTVSIDLSITTGVGAGFAGVGLPVPNVTGLIGQSLYAQWFSIATGANPLGAVTTQGGIVTIR